MIDDGDSILQDLSTEQRAACIQKGNILLTACPGSGKTRTITHRLAYTVQKNPDSRKLNIAITYTNRAADEITARLEKMDVSCETIWTGTIHKFCMHFIIRPYAMYSSRLNKGYRVIDEYIKKQYGNDLAAQHGLDIQWGENPFDNEIIQRDYERILEEKKEIDFDMILQISYDLLATHPFIATNVAAITNSILVDEFQDTNELQYLILAQIYKANKTISIMFSGDINQAIYGSLGGVAKNLKELESIYDTAFEPMSLTGCYRSTQRIVDLYNRFAVSETNVLSVAEHRYLAGKICYSKSISCQDLASSIASVISSEIEAGTKPNDICIVAPQWFLLFQLAKQLRVLLPEVLFDAPDISPIKYDPLNPLFLVAQLLFMPAGRNVIFRKQIASEFITAIRDDFKISVSDSIESYDILNIVNKCRKIDGDGIKCLRCAIAKVFELLEISISNDSQISDLQNDFFSKIEDRVHRYSLPTDYESISRYFRERNGIVVTTIHGVKGEEFKTVIASGLLNGYLPNWKYILNPEKKYIRIDETKKLLYVLCSRAKENLYLYSERGHKTKKGSEYLPTDELQRILSGEKI